MYYSRYIYQHILFVKNLTTVQFYGGNKACKADERAAGEKWNEYGFFFFIVWPRLPHEWNLQRLQVSHLTKSSVQTIAEGWIKSFMKQQSYM